MKAYVPRGPQSGTMHLRSARSQSPQSPQIWSAVNCAHTRGSASRSWLVSTATEVHILCKHARSLKPGWSRASTSASKPEDQKNLPKIMTRAATMLHDQA